MKLLAALDLPAVGERGRGSVDEMLRRLKAGAHASLDSRSRLHGLRVEAMFRAVLVSLGGFRLLVEEDEGQLYYDDAQGTPKLPDYRVVDSDGRQLLIEVKAVPPGPNRLRHSISAGEFQGLSLYGELTGAPVAIAHYWAVMNVWTLIDLDQMARRGDRYEIELTEAMKLNQMARFGDANIGTVPPLELRLEVEELGERESPDTATIVTRKVELLAAGQELEDEVERRIAFLLFRHGRWEVDMPAETDSDGRVTSVTLRAAPPDDVMEIVERQGFALVGALSSLYSAMFNELTLNDEGAVERLDHHSEPGEFGTLIPADYFDREDRRLSLWVFRQQPG